MERDIDMDRVTNYGGYRIEAKVYAVDGKRGPEHVVKWIAGQYSISKMEGGGYSEKPVVHETRYCNTEEEATHTTWQLAREGIDRGHVGFRL